MKKKRTYNTRLVRRSRSYTVQEIASLYQLYPNAVHRWVKEGLACIDEHKPQRIHGSELIAFLSERQNARKGGCSPEEAFCCKCRKPQAFWERMVDLVIRNAKQLNIIGLCGVCSTPMFKGGSVRKLPDYRKLFHVQTVREEHLIPCVTPTVKSEIERSE